MVFVYQFTTQNLNEKTSGLHNIEWNAHKGNI